MASESVSPKQDNPLLTGIRGVAAVWVSLFHFYPWISATFHVAPRGAIPFVRDGFLGVDLFFLLSGYVLMLSHGPRLATGAPAAIVRFMIARAFRIVPMHWTMLLVLAAIVAIVPGFVHRPYVFTGRTFFESLLLVQGMLPDATVAWNRPTWSISDEFVAYLLFPLLALLIWTIRNAWAAFVLAAIALLALWLDAKYGLHAHTLNIVHPGGLARCFCEFSAGAFACKVWQLDPAKVQRLATILTIGGLLALAAAIRYSSHLDLLAPFGLLALVMGSGARSAVAKSLFANPMAVFLGEISYSLYLIHIVLFDLLSLAVIKTMVSGLAVWPKAVFGLLTWCLLLLLSWCGHRYVEQPSRLVGRRVVARLLPVTRLRADGGREKAAAASLAGRDGGS